MLGVDETRIEGLKRAMKGLWFVLAIGICAVARAASAQHEQPSHDDRSSGGDVGHGDAGHGDSGNADVGGHDSPSDSSPSSGEDSGRHGSDNSSGSSDSSPSWSSGGETRYSDDSGPPPEARPRDPDTVEPPPTDAQERHPRPQAGPDGQFPNPPVTEGGIWDRGDYGVTDPRHDPSPFDDYGYTDSPDPSRKPTEHNIPLRLLVKPDHAAVYVNGQYAGIVKELRGKGTLHLSPGVHVIALVLEGYRPGRAYVPVLAGASEIKVRGQLERIGPE